MRYAMIMAGGSGTRLWPMSRAKTPKQLIPFIGGKSLIEIACDRLDGLVEPQRRFVCAGTIHKDAIRQALPEVGDDQYLAEPVGRDTVNAVAFAAAVIARQDPDAVIAVFTADHIIEPVDQFQQIVAAGFAMAERDDATLVTFGIKPTHAATGYGYLELAGAVTAGDATAFAVNKFKEKPDATTAEHYHQAGPDRYLWNSGMFVWKARTLLRCIEQYQPSNHAILEKIADAWATDKRDETIEELYPTLDKISVDYAVMEPASKDPNVSVVAVPMPLFWLDVGSWPSFALTAERDEHGNAIAADQQIMLDCRSTLVASNDPQHLIATIGCEDLIIVHTHDATLVCHANRAEDIKKIHGMVKEKIGEEKV